ncbi:MAG: UDP-N-acetylmuramoyl-L-alanine--D-glutamate ligase, partial [Muribaculaceae bacterium]|nr:UDP-N-acetylmuramoyl-L-alanine--D-glutamate ligase [Muribaculaceae bacterium]
MKKIAILGGGESGTGAAVLAKDKGFDVFLSDTGNLAPKYREILDREQIAYESGTPHTESRVLSADIIIKSPGIPPTAPIIVRAMEAGIPVLSEIEFAGRYTDAKMLCITGSNGKTTTTTLLHHILTHAGLDASMAGNVGDSLAMQVARDPHDIYVVELSSFQLDNMYDFRADIAI